MNATRPRITHRTPSFINNNRTVSIDCSVHFSWYPISSHLRVSTAFQLDPAIHRLVKFSDDSDLDRRRSLPPSEVLHNVYLEVRAMVLKAQLREERTVPYDVEEADGLVAGQHERHEEVRAGGTVGTSWWIWVTVMFAYCEPTARVFFSPCGSSKVSSLTPLRRDLLRRRSLPRQIKATLTEG